MTENEFCDTFILEVISKYGTERRPTERQSQPRQRQYATAIRISHGSRLFPSSEKSRYVYCYFHNTVSYTQRKCPDCLDTPPLCRRNEKDCHTAWHSSMFSVIRRLWYDKKNSNRNTTEESTIAKPRGRPKGSINRNNIEDVIAIAWSAWMKLSNRNIKLQL